METNKMMPMMVCAWSHCYNVISTRSGRPLVRTDRRLTSLFSFASMIPRATPAMDRMIAMDCVPAWIIQVLGPLSKRMKTAPMMKMSHAMHARMPWALVLTIASIGCSNCEFTVTPFCQR